MADNLLGMDEAEAARVVGVCKDTLRNWRKDGKVGYTLTPGGRIRYTPEQLHQLVRSMKVEAKLGKRPN